MKQSPIHIAGILLILISSGLFGLELIFDIQSSNQPLGGPFLFHYIPTVIYLIAVIWTLDRNYLFFYEDNFTLHSFVLILFNISAFSLNRIIPVFNESADWLSIFLLVENALLFSYALLKERNRLIEFVLAFFMPMALIFHIYQLSMVLPVAPFALIASPFFGISLLLFVPVFYLLCIIVLLKRIQWFTKYRWISASACFITVSIVLSYCIRWHQLENSIIDSKLTTDAPYADDQGLTDWISIAQFIDDKPLTEKYLKSGLVYQEYPKPSGIGFSSILRSSFDERYVHDPLISMASLFTKEDALDESTKIKILNYLYDSRHQSADRFWNGKNLKTKQVVTNVELFPNERLSFTEQIITISNEKSNRSRWGNQQEALYTFDIPEGGVVTSLSLWIEGQEAKAILTSKKKAEKAYNTIVGKEMRDPSVVYWMEGNKIRVRVFPCTPEEDRKFKIGVTAPLLLNNESLEYHAFKFMGPEDTEAKAAIHVVSHGADILESTMDLQQEALYYSWQGNYQKDWMLQIPKNKPLNSIFSFQGEHFQIKKTNDKTVPFDPKRVYLDLSRNWSKEELEQLSEILIGKEVYLFNKGLNKLNDLKELQNLSTEELPAFNLFPFHKANWQDAMIITKGGMATPNLSDLENTPFYQELFAQLNNQKSSPLVIDIDSETSHYMKSLKEFKVIDYHSMELADLEKCIKSQRFPSSNFSQDIIDIPLNGLSIEKLDEKPEDINSASDHLMRLFYYQQVMSQIGQKYFADDRNEMLEEEIVEQAELANIVTPVSSLIVLETQKDYDRFEIEKKTDALGNASISNAGAVPEPHEWALIIVGVILISFMYLKSRA